MRNANYTLKLIKVIFNRTLLILFYIMIAAGLGFGGYYLYLTNYDFYFEEESYEIEKGTTEKITFVTTKSFKVQKGDYVYKIEDEKVASTDQNGNVKGLKVGVTYLSVNYKNSIFPKKVKIIVVPNDDEVIINDTPVVPDGGEEQVVLDGDNSSVATSDDGGELELPF